VRRQRRDPLVAREMIRNLNPDVITLDVEMPRMDGIDFLSKLMRLRPMPVVMVSTLTERGAEVTLKALELGAIDFVAKPKIGVADGLRQLARTSPTRSASPHGPGCQSLAGSPAPGAVPRATPRRPAKPAEGPAGRPRWAGCRPRKSSSSAPPPAAPKPPRKC
jgi:two-component system chemotaxis response regulator CheB